MKHSVINKYLEINSVDKYKMFFRADKVTATDLDGQLKLGEKDIYWVPVSYNKLRDVVEYIDENDFESQLLKDFYEEYSFDRIDEDLKIFMVHDERLRDYQNLHIDRIKARGSYGLFFQMRMGKTPTSIVATSDSNKIVVSVPKGLEVSWQREFMNWVDREAVILKGTPKKREEMYRWFNESDNAVLIGSRDTLARDEINGSFLGKYDYLIVDEAHFLSNTSRTKGVRNGKEGKFKTLRTGGTELLNKKAENRLVLTGTPAKKDMHDVIPLLRFIEPNIPSKWGLIEYFMGTTKTRFATEINPVKKDKINEWASFQMEYCGIEKTMDRLEWLQETQYQTIVLEKSSPQKKYEKQITNLFMAKDDGGRVISMVENVMNQLGKLQEIMLDTKIIGAEKSSPKTDWLMDWISENQDESVVIWAKSAKYLKELKEDLDKAGINCLLSNGSVEKSKRQEMVDDFQKGKVKIILCGTDTMKEGYTMDTANTMIYLQRDWNAVNMAQSDFRFIDTKKKELHMPKMIIDVQMEDSIDQYVEEVYKGKITRTELANNAHKYLTKF